MTDLPAALRPAPAVQTGGASLVTGVNVFRGLTIALVVLLHASGSALPQLTDGQTASTAMQFLNRALQFVVPAFLFISAALLTRSLTAKPDLGRYVQRRVLRGVWPYVLWTALFALWYVWRGERPVTELQDPGRWLFWIAYGKASFHLYFLLVALELYVLLPLLLPLMRRRPSPTLTFLVGAGVQALVFVLNAAFFHFRFPASTLLWYLLPVLVGAALGTRLDDFPGWWRRHRVWVTVLLILSAALYLPQAVALVDGEDVATWAYSLSHWLYSTLASVALLGFSLGAARLAPRVAQVLAALGTLSMPIYLIHPALLQLLGDLGFPGQLWAFVLVFVVYAAASVALPWLIGRAVWGTKISDLLFGR